MVDRPGKNGDFPEGKIKQTLDHGGWRGSSHFIHILSIFHIQGMAKVLGGYQNL